LAKEALLGRQLAAEEEERDRAAAIGNSEEFVRRWAPRISGLKHEVRGAAIRHVARLAHTLRERQRCRPTVDRRVQTGAGAQEGTSAACGDDVEMVQRGAPLSA